MLQIHLCSHKDAGMLGAPQALGQAQQRWGEVTEAAVGSLSVKDRSDMEYYGVCSVCL